MITPDEITAFFHNEAKRLDEQRRTSAAQPAASANARPQVPGAKRRSSAEDEAAEAASQRKQRRIVWLTLTLATILFWTLAAIGAVTVLGEGPRLMVWAALEKPLPCAR